MFEKPNIKFSLRKKSQFKLKIGLITRGIADVYVELGPYTKLWDACGPDAILRATGGQFTNILGEPLTYGLTQLKNTHGLVATNGAIHEKVIKGLEPITKIMGLMSKAA